MICKIIASFMRSDPARTKLEFWVSDRNSADVRLNGYISMTNDQADHFLTTGYPTSLAAAHSPGGDGTHDIEIDSDTYFLEDRRGRELHG